MASGAVVAEGFQVKGPATSQAELTSRAGGSTPAEVFGIASFDDSSIEYLDIHMRLAPNYDGGGLTIRLPWAAASATTGNVKWDAAIRRVADDAEDVDGAHTYSFQTTTDAAPSASGEFTDVVITFSSGAAMDNLAAGEKFVLRIRRHADDGADTMTGDAQLAYNEVAVRET